MSIPEMQPHRGRRTSAELQAKPADATQVLSVEQDSTLYNLWWNTLGQCITEATAAHLASRLDGLGIPWRVQNAIAYAAERGQGYAATLATLGYRR